MCKLSKIFYNCMILAALLTNWEKPLGFFQNIAYEKGQSKELIIIILPIIKQGKKISKSLDLRIYF